MCVSGYCFMHIALIWPMMWVPSLPGWICWYDNEMYIKDIKTELCVIGVGKIDSVMNLTVIHMHKLLIIAKLGT